MATKVFVRQWAIVMLFIDFPTDDIHWICRPSSLIGFSDEFQTQNWHEGHFPSNEIGYYLVEKRREQCFRDRDCEINLDIIWASLESHKNRMILFVTKSTVVSYNQALDYINCCKTRHIPLFHCQAMAKDSYFDENNKMKYIHVHIYIYIYIYINVKLTPWHALSYYSKYHWLQYINTYRLWNYFSIQALLDCSMGLLKGRNSSVTGWQKMALRFFALN